MSFEKLHNSSHPRARELDKMYNDVRSSRKVCKSCGQIGYLFELDGVCMADECKAQKEAYKRYRKTFNVYDLKKHALSLKNDFLCI